MSFFFIFLFSFILKKISKITVRKRMEAIHKLGSPWLALFNSTLFMYS